MAPLLPSQALWLRAETVSSFKVLPKFFPNTPQPINFPTFSFFLLPFPFLFVILKIEKLSRHSFQWQINLPIDHL